MNERIEKLAEQAEEWNADGDKCEVNLHKFAELIVQECIELNRQELSFSAFARMLDKYEEHFGVEE
jgi:hypothetical protein